MSIEKWQTPLNEIADPFGMRKLAEDTAEVAFAEQLAAVASAPDFSEAYKIVLLSLSNASKFRESEEADFLLGAGDAAIIDSERNIRLLNAGVDYCRGRNNAAKDSSKKNAWQKCQTHLSNWSQAFSSSSESLAAALFVDKILHNTKGAISVDDALAAVRKVGLASFEPLPEIVRWYLFNIRKKYRKDIDILAPQVECPKCHGKHDDGAECPRCRETEAALEAAKKALGAKNWKKAWGAADIVLGVWRDNPDAKIIRDTAVREIETERAAAEVERKHRADLAAALRTANDSIGAALKAGNLELAEEKFKAAKDLAGFDVAKWQAEIERARRAAAERKAEEEERERKEAEVAAAREAFYAALQAGEWEKATSHGRDLARLLGNEASSEFSKKIDESKKNRRGILESACKKTLASFDAAFPSHPDEAAAAINSAKSAVQALRKEFPLSPEVGKTASGIQGRQKKLDLRRQELLVENLLPARNLTANGSSGGHPKIDVKWEKPSGGTPAAKWRVLRREKGATGPAKKLDEVSSPPYTDNGSVFKIGIGVEYEYAVIPLAEIAPEQFKANDKAKEIWSDPAVCLVKLAEDALDGKGEGMEGVGGSVSLTWTLPQDLGQGPRKILLSREDGKFRDKDVTDFNGSFEDAEVSVGTSYEYMLRVLLNGRDIGTSRKNVTVSKVQPPPMIAGVSFARQAGALLVKWEWPADLDTCVWGVTTGKVSRAEEIPKIALNHVARNIYEKNGGVMPIVPANGLPRWFSVFGVRSFGEREFYSPGQSVPIAETILSYAVENHPGGLFSRRQPSWLVISSSTGYVPEIELRLGRTKGEVLSRNGGRSAGIFDFNSLHGSMRINLDGKAAPGEFVRIYLVRPNSENCKLVHPKEFEVK